MKRNYILSVIIISTCVFNMLFFSRCADRQNDVQSTTTDTVRSDFGEFESQVKYGEHLVLIGGCHDCHSPKKFSEHGMELDSSMLLSGHHRGTPEPSVNRKDIEGKGLIVTNDLTTWVGPWGVSYTANLTSDSTGLGNWKEEQFIYAIRNGKFKGLPSSRPLLPPMPWDMYKNMTDNELKAIFAYLKTTKPVSNVVPPPQPPASAGRK